MPVIILMTPPAAPLPSNCCYRSCSSGSLVSVYLQGGVGGVLFLVFCSSFVCVTLNFKSGFVSAKAL